METTLIFGHKTPDTDSVCSSISLSYLKNKLGMRTEPRVLGPINKESKFVLNYFKVKEPSSLNDVKVQVRNMNYLKNAMISEDASIYETYRMLGLLEVTGLPIVDHKKVLKGYVNVKEISRYLIDGNQTYLKTSYTNMISDLEATDVLRFDEEIEGNVIVASYKSETFIQNVTLGRNDILIVGDRYKILEYAVNSGVKMLIMVNGGELPAELLEIAKKNKVNVLSVMLDTYKCSNLVRLCNYVKLININDHPVTFSIYDYRDDFVAISSKLGHTNYPIVNKKNECLGLMRLIDTNNFVRQHVILVDHNVQTQSVDGIDEADIVEVIDHHNLGTIGTTSPINFRSMPVGCTCTVIYKLYQEANVDIPKDMAGLMLSAILSDTLLFKSPTTTDLDIETGKALASIAGVDLNEYGMEMFKAASSIEGMSAQDIINSDIKIFKAGDINFAIGQLTTMDLDNVKKLESDIIATLNSMCNVGNLEIAVLFVTDIINNGSYLLFNEEAKDVLSNAYNVDDLEQSHYFPGYVSRKKQMLPPVLEILERRN